MHGMLYSVCRIGRRDRKLEAYATGDSVTSMTNQRVAHVE
ncbi:hypothetical protein TBK1r_75120 [Stieleria magnilauensis]|uniref:Uncharacterized protein n=1 Tax=Stieleria magnilauensis TaxID=2527963 RepID=A0ABX5Y8C4_9BACT|nr:hypothetical protein TBK1r_75120 [Planctomycetes bacterium TBK1r]